MNGHNGRSPRTRFLALSAALLATALAASQAAIALAADPPDGETIYFWRSSGGATMAVRPDGSGLAEVGCPGDRTHGGASRRVLRVERDGDLYQLVSRNEACGDPVVLWAPGAGYVLGTTSWSIDGSRVAIDGRRLDDGGAVVEQGIWVGEVGGACGAPLCGVHLAATPGGALPRWSPDGRRVVYGRPVDPGNPDSGGIFVADLGLPGSTTVRRTARWSSPAATPTASTRRRSRRCRAPT